MTAQPAAGLRMTPEEYFAWEEAQEVRHEYADGEVFAMAGGTIEHARLTGNVITALNAVLRDSGCAVYSGDLRVQLAEGVRYTYPDAVVVCGEARLLAGGRTTLLNPTVLVEVLSSPTGTYDRGEKIYAYRQIATLQEYVLVAQDGRRVEVFRRAGDEWALRTFEEGEVELAALGVRVPLDELYRGVSPGAA